MPFLARRKERAHGVGGFNADVMLCAVLEDDVMPDETANIVKINQDAIESVKSHFPYCLSDDGCGMISE